MLRYGLRLALIFTIFRFLSGTAAAQSFSMQVSDTIFGAVGVADIEITPEGYVFLSCFDRRSQQQSASVQGAVYAYDLEAGEPKLRDLTIQLPFPFVPRGLSYYPTAKNAGVLFVVNHHPKGRSIEQFTWDGDRLAHFATFSDPLLTAPCDVAALDATRFYVTNENGGRHRFGRYVENTLRLSKSNIVFYDGKTFRIAAGRLGLASGLCFSVNRRQLFVANQFQKTVQEYDVAETGALVSGPAYKFRTGVRHIARDLSGDLWVTGQDGFFRFVRQTLNEDIATPWTLYRLRFDAVGHAQAQEIYHSHAPEFSGVSVACPYKDVWLIGAIYARYALKAKLTPLQQHAILP